MRVERRNGRLSPMYYVPRYCRGEHKKKGTVEENIRRKKKGTACASIVHDSRTGPALKQHLFIDGI